MLVVVERQDGREALQKLTLIHALIPLLKGRPLTVTKEESRPSTITPLSIIRICPNQLS